MSERPSSLTTNEGSLLNEVARDYARTFQKIWLLVCLYGFFIFALHGFTDYLVVRAFDKIPPSQEISSRVLDHKDSSARNNLATTFVEKQKRMKQEQQIERTFRRKIYWVFFPINLVFSLLLSARLFPLLRSQPFQLTPHLVVKYARCILDKYLRPLLWIVPSFVLGAIVIGLYSKILGGKQLPPSFPVYFLGIFLFWYGYCLLRRTFVGPLALMNEKRVTTQSCQLAKGHLWQIFGTLVLVSILPSVTVAVVRFFLIMGSFIQKDSGFLLESWKMNLFESSVNALSWGALMIMPFSALNLFTKEKKAKENEAPEKKAAALSFHDTPAL